MEGYSTACHNRGSRQKFQDCTCTDHHSVPVTNKNLIYQISENSVNILKPLKVYQLIWPSNFTIPPCTNSFPPDEVKPWKYRFDGAVPLEINVRLFHVIVSKSNMYRSLKQSSVQTTRPGHYQSLNIGEPEWREPIQSRLNFNSSNRSHQQNMFCRQNFQDLRHDMFNVLFIGNKNVWVTEWWVKL